MNYASNSTDIIYLIASEPVPKKMVTFGMCARIVLVFSKLKSGNYVILLYKSHVTILKLLTYLGE